MEKFESLQLPKLVGYNDVEFHDLMSIYNKQADYADRLYIADMLNLKAYVIKDQNNDIVGGFFFQKNKTLEPELVDKYGQVDNIYLTGLVKTEGKQQKVSMLRFLQSKVKDFMGSGFLVWGLVSDKDLLAFYKKSGYEITPSPTEGDPYSVVVFN